MSAIPRSPDDAALAAKARAWPFEEARRVMRRLGNDFAGRTIVFQTGYGPSGLPHIGTFGEVARTVMVRHAFDVLTKGACKSRLICFSDDLDGMRKVPDNVPNREMLLDHLDMPLSAVPNPFDDDHKSFAAHNNARLCAFLDRFGFDYEFTSATECYKSGRFDETLVKVLHHHEEIRDIVAPTLGAERRTTYSPILPICPTTGKVLQVKIDACFPDKGTFSYTDPQSGASVELPVTGGHAKLQWRADWAMRWAALGVDYEMSGKDLIDSVRLSSRICKVLGARPPEGFHFELFLDENGAKISKSVGNGLTIDEWLRYATPESLWLFMYQSPRKAKRLFFDVIPRNVDDYLTFVEKYADLPVEKRLESPVWHIHGDAPPAASVPISFAMLLNLVSASNAQDAKVLWGFIGNYAPKASPENNPQLDAMVGYAINYFHDFIKPAKHYRAPNDQERAALGDLRQKLAALPQDADAQTYQNVIYAVGNEAGFDPLRAWFQAIYEVLLGQTQGPRFGSFIALYGRSATLDLFDQALAKDQPDADFD
ncbi:MAG: lysine--tRNA ligase [Alphaproteobacteria bacterium]